MSNTSSRPKWQRKLNAEQRAHLNYATMCGTLAEFKRQLAHQRATAIRCHACDSIAATLGI